MPAGNSNGSKKHRVAQRVGAHGDREQLHASQNRSKYGHDSVAPKKSTAAAEPHATESDSRRFTVDDIHDLAKIGGEILKRTVSSGIDVIKDVKEGLPKEASNLLNKGKEEVLKGINREMLNNMISVGLDKFFAKVREHKLDITLSVRLRKEEESSNLNKK